ncbi:MAG: pyruvate formate lyase family protein, partial [Cyanobacteria bacterium J06649_11]
MMEQWNGFETGKWMKEINIRDFIQKNYKPYRGNDSFLTGATKQTQTLWNQVKNLMKTEREKEILDVDIEVVSTITSHQPGYINRDLEQIVGLQTDKPLKRAIMPFGGIRVVKSSLEAYRY